MLKLMTQPRKSQLITVSLVVLRINKRGELRNSRPCLNCLKQLQHLHSYGYKLCNVYYSNENGEIVKKKFLDLLEDEIQHVSRGNK